MPRISPPLSRLAALVVRRPWWFVGVWLVLAAGLNLAVPQLETVVSRDSTPILPSAARSAVALKTMDRVFGNGRSTSFLFVVLERPTGLTAGDRQYARALVPRLEARHGSVTFVQDIVHRRDLMAALTSRDGKAMYFQVGIPGATGAPTSITQIDAVRGLVETGPPRGLHVAVTGPAATVADMATAVDRSILLITIATVALIALLLLAIYRSVAVAALILGMIGIALAVARGLSSWMGLHVFSVSTFTGSFLTGVVLGASTDYAVFLVSRYQELRRAGTDPSLAASQAAAKVGGVIVGSALTVMVANAAMATAKVGIYLTTGPAIAVSIAATLLVALTLAPAVLAIAARRGLMEPRARTGAARWDRLGSGVVARPARVLAAGLIPLVALAAFYPSMHLSFDERAVQPPATDSNRGYRLLAAHFPLNEVLPDYVLVRSPHDLRNAADLAALEEASRAVARIPGVVSVRGITRPLGRPIAQASVGYRAGVVGARLGDAQQRVAQGSGGAAQLVDGSHQLDSGARALAGGAGQVADGARRSAAGATTLTEGTSTLAAGLQRLQAATGTASSGSDQLRSGAASLAAALAAGQQQAQVAVSGLGQALAALNGSLGCSLDPICARARAGVAQVYAGEHDQMLAGLSQAAEGARALASGAADLHDGLDQIEAGLASARLGAEQIHSGQQLLGSKLGDLASGATKVADGSSQVADAAGRVAGGTQQMDASLQDLQQGLGRAATVLRRTATAAEDPAIGGFYLPPAALGNARLATATSLFLSPDGHTARLVVLGGTDAFAREASQRAHTVAQVVRGALRGTPIAGARVDATGMGTIDSDLDHISTHEFDTVALIALLAVLLILIALLRSLVAPLFLLASVCLSYAAAMGLGVLVWQELLGRPLDWSVPTIAFILLVAVGADYNLLMMKRMLEEAPDGNRPGIARAVAATGSVITAAGLIFAASMYAMMSGSVTTLAQIGFTVGTGLLLDTFVVRTLIVPSVAALAGRRIWWPRQPGVSARP